MIRPESAEPAAPPSGLATGSPGPARTGRTWLLLLGTAYLTFVIYGSLVPMAFRPVPWPDAVERFRAIPFLQLGIGSRADWVANLLLFIPLAFLWAGVVWPRERALWRLPVASLLVLLALGLALAIEFTQIFFPPRTVSINDIGAETLGAILGVAAWWALGSRIERWFLTLPLARGTTSLAQRLLLAYLLLLYGYNLLPLDLTISPVEIYHKWREGKLVLLPFTAPFASRAQQAYDLVTDAAIWVPVATLWRLARRGPALQAWTACFAAAVLLELLQLFVFSRVSDTTDIVTAAIGAVIGTRLAAVWLPRSAMSANQPPPNTTTAGMLPWLLATAVWACMLALVFWYPFDFNFDRSFLRSRVAELGRVPFAVYYYGTEFRAITEVLHKIGFFAPLGFLLFMLGSRLPAAWPRGLVHALALLLIGACAVAIEGGQLPLPGKYADATDVALEFAGGALGYFGSRYLSSRFQQR